MSAAFWTALAAIVIGGIGLAVQGPINATLARAAGGLAAATVSFGVGFAVLVALTLLRGGVPEAAALKALPWWAWTGGFLGAYFVWATLTHVGTLGVLTMAAAVVLGQLLAAMALDATGAFGLGVQAVSLPRLLAVALVAGGLVLSRF